MAEYDSLLISGVTSAPTLTLHSVGVLAYFRKFPWCEEWQCYL